MRITPVIAVGTLLLALPAGALAAGPPSGHPTGNDNPGVEHRPAWVTVPSPAPQAAPEASGRLPSAASGEDTTGSPTAGTDDMPGPSASASKKAKAYGRYCKGVSRKRAAGARRTPFSVCVTGMAKLANGRTSSPRAACKGVSRKHVAGAEGTPFSLCVSGAAKLRRDRAATDDTATDTTPADTTTA